jgi:hypothetical protein
MVLSALSPLRGEYYHEQLQLRGTPVQKTLLPSFSDPVGLESRYCYVVGKGYIVGNGYIVNCNCRANSRGRSSGMLDPFRWAKNLPFQPFTSLLSYLLQVLRVLDSPNSASFGEEFISLAFSSPAIPAVDSGSAGGANTGSLSGAKTPLGFLLGQK